MIIERIELFQLPPRWTFLKVTTRSGLYGWGEPALDGRSESLTAVLGQDARRIEDIFQVLSKGGFYRFGILVNSAISGIEQALWDLKGKNLGVSVYELLGGAVRDKMRIYAWVGGDSPEDASFQARQRIEAGFSAIKMNVAGKLEMHLPISNIKTIKKRIALVGETIGDDNDLAIDFHGRIHKNTAKVLVKEQEELSPMFYEEPLLPHFSLISVLLMY